MKKSGVTRLLAMGLSFVMIFSMVACNSKSKADTFENESQETSENENSEGGNLADSEGETVKEFEFFGNFGSPYQAENAIYDALQEATGINVNFTWNSPDSYSTVLAARITNQDLPDVIGCGLDTEVRQNLIDEGLIIPLTDLLEEYMPNYMRFITEDDYLFLQDQQDGEVYAFGMIVDVPGVYSYMIRQDWLDNLSLKQPETWDEYVEVWTAFKEQDANGNGDPNDEIPFMCNYENFYRLEAIYGIESNGYFSVVDGEYVYDPEHPLYGEWLDAMWSLYKNGLISAEFIEIDTATQINLMSSNRVGSAFTDAAIASSASKACAEIDEDAYFICTSPIIGPYGDQKISRRPKISTTHYITQKAVDEGKLDAILEFFDFLFSDEGILITDYGIEGESYTMVDNEPVIMESFCDPSAAREWGLIPTPLGFYWGEDSYHQIVLKSKSGALDNYTESVLGGLTTNNEPYFYTAPVIISSDAKVEYNDLIQEQIALRDNYIMGKIAKDEYTKRYEALKEQGLSEVITQGNAIYQSLVN